RPLHGARISLAAGQARTDLGGQRFGDLVAQVAGQCLLAQLRGGGDCLGGNDGGLGGNDGGARSGVERAGNKQGGSEEPRYSAHHDSWCDWKGRKKTEAASLTAGGFDTLCSTSTQA